MVRNIVLTVAALALMVVGGCGVGPGAPTGLTATPTSSSITLSWTAVTGATSYNVWRGTVSGGLSTKSVLVKDITATTYSDTTALAGTTYYYQVTAVNSDGASNASNEASATAQSSAGGLFDLKGAKNGSQITLIWNTVSGAVSYNVYRGTTTSTFSSKQKIANVVAPATLFTDTFAFISGTTYFYQVTAVNSDGTEQSQVSNEVPITF